MKTTAVETKGRLVQVTVPLESAYASLDKHVKQAYKVENYTLVGSFDPKKKFMTGFTVFIADPK